MRECIILLTYILDQNVCIDHMYSSFCNVFYRWGGNYFMVGGSVKGGEVLGRYPQPLSPENDYWIGR